MQKQLNINNHAKGQMQGKTHTYLRFTSYQQSLLSTLVTYFFDKSKILVGKASYKSMPKKTVVIIPYFMPEANGETVYINQGSFEGLNPKHLSTKIGDAKKQNDHNKGSETSQATDKLFPGMRTHKLISRDNEELSRSWSGTSLYQVLATKKPIKTQEYTDYLNEKNFSAFISAMTKLINSWNHSSWPSPTLYKWWVPDPHQRVGEEQDHIVDKDRSHAVIAEGAHYLKKSKVKSLLNQMFITNYKDQKKFLSTGWEVFMSQVIRGKLKDWRYSQQGLVKQVEVRFVRLQYPYLDSLILAKYLAINGDKFSFSRMQKSLFSSAPTISISSVVPETSNADVLEVPLTPLLAQPCWAPPYFTVDGTGSDLYLAPYQLVGKKLVKIRGVDRRIRSLASGQQGWQKSAVTRWNGNLSLKESIRDTVPIFNSYYKESVINPSTEVQSLLSWGLPAQLTGIKLELAGRLTTQRSIPRKTVDNTYTGTFSAPLTTVVSKTQNSSLDFKQYASKNKLGAFTVKTWISAKMK